MDKNTKIGIALGTILAVITGNTMFAYADALTRQLEMGMTGEDVGMLQRFLATDPEVYPEAIVSSYFGQLTKNAVMKYQSKNGIAPVGRVGPQTMTFINSQMGSSTNATTSATSTGANSSSSIPGMLININSSK